MLTETALQRKESLNTAHFKKLLTKPIFKSEKYSISGDYATGVAFNWLHFSLQHPERTAMGGAVSCYLDATLLLTREVSDNVDFSFGLSKRINQAI